MKLINPLKDMEEYNKDICPYIKKHAKEDYLFGNKQTFCDVKECPYQNQIEPEFMVEKLPKICTSKGLIKKLK